MFKTSTFKNVLFKWMPHKEQTLCERKLIKVIKRLNIDDFHFNWDRSSCFIEFTYQEKSYRLEHSIDSARKRGIILRNGLDCLNELAQSLEDLCEIINRGTYNFETWISGMTHHPLDQEPSDYEEEFHIRYKSSGRQSYSEYGRDEEFVPFDQESALRDFEQNQHIPRSQRR
ncbi:hypothetical protein [Halobacillus campisalis]|uniref:Uncharacterized protein n=1 Tax=Halobacillus campisalis TaxID=435909 RepID=A0ABW2K301_9BACI|nr:hypothetical protein [Halobacillus campisalis]